MKISRNALDFMLEAARSSYPLEFIGMLRAENDIITEVLIIPGSKFGKNYSSVFLNMIPLDPSIIGSVHSHPGIATPSKADLHFFSKLGRVHIIVSANGEMRAFDTNGTPIALEIVK